MPDLILRPSTIRKDKPFVLQLRIHGPAETEYCHIAYVSKNMAKAIIEAGKAFWLFGDPDEEKE